jgi:hypothetical protein
MPSQLRLVTETRHKILNTRPQAVLELDKAMCQPNAFRVLSMSRKRDVRCRWCMGWRRLQKQDEESQNNSEGYCVLLFLVDRRREKARPATGGETGPLRQWGNVSWDRGIVRDEFCRSRYSYPARRVSSQGWGRSCKLRSLSSEGARSRMYPTRWFASLF